MNIHFIEGFLETVRQKSIAKASEKLCISHPALSKQIRALEAYYSVVLFKRSPSGVELTDAGKILYDRLLPVYTEMNSIKAELAGITKNQPLTIGALPSLAAHFLPPIVFEMNNRNLDVKVIVRSTSQELHELLSHEQIDAALLENELDHTKPAAAWSVDLFEEPYYAVVYPNHPLAISSSVTVKELGTEPLILNPPDCSIRRRMTALIANHGIEPRIKAEVNFGDFIVTYVGMGAGITILPRIAAIRLQDPNIMSIPIDDADAMRTVSLLTRSDKIGKRLTPYFKRN